MTKLISEILRPTSFDDLVISDEIKMRLNKMRDTTNVMNMLFYGKPGTGKTSAAMIFVNNEKFETITINGSLETSVEDVRSRIRNFSSSVSLYDQQKIVFIDEADYLSKNAQAGLRKVIEDSSENCRFIFTANEIKKIHSALCSRLMLICFDMTATQIQKSLSLYKTRVLKVMKEKFTDIDQSRVNQIIDMYYPDYRSVANHLEFEYI
jgi:replication-associated recombination protein RarA